METNKNELIFSMSKENSHLSHKSKYFTNIIQNNSNLAAFASFWKQILHLNFHKSCKFFKLHKLHKLHHFIWIELWRYEFAQYLQCFIEISIIAWFQKYSLYAPKLFSYSKIYLFHLCFWSFCRKFPSLICAKLLPLFQNLWYNNPNSANLHKISERMWYTSGWKTKGGFECWKKYLIQLKILKTKKIKYSRAASEINSFLIEEHTLKLTLNDTQKKSISFLNTYCSTD